MLKLNSRPREELPAGPKGLAVGMTPQKLQKEEARHCASFSRVPKEMPSIQCMFLVKHVFL